MRIKHRLKSFYRRYIKPANRNKITRYFFNYSKYSFDEDDCHFREQYEANITRLYHTIEKGLSYEDFRPGFGKANINLLISQLKAYSNKYGSDEFFYQTALSTLYSYIEKNKYYGYYPKKVVKEINQLPGFANDCGGVVTFTPTEPIELKKMNYEQLVKSRHSIRHFSSSPVDVSRIKLAIELAQFTPSACNRQGWKSRIIEDQKVKTQLLNNQNGNRGFGSEIDKLIMVTGDLKYFSVDREMFQVYIDGGMYAKSVLDSLHFYGIATIPLSVALSYEQEKEIRSLINMSDSEVFVLLIGIGNYPDNCITTRSARKPVNIEII